MLLRPCPLKLTCGVVALAFVASTALAQEQPDPFGDAVREQEDVRARALEKAMSAPAAAETLWRNTDLNLGMDDPRRPQGASELVPPPPTETPFPWTFAIVGGALILGGGLFLVGRRLADG